MKIDPMPQPKEKYRKILKNQLKHWYEQ